MTTTYSTVAFDEGTAVRLFVDTGHASIGVIVELDRVREADGEHFWRVDFDPANESETSTVVAQGFLVPVCEHFESHPDEYGLACSEPGVPTTFEIVCRKDADRVLTWADSFGIVHVNLCLDHAIEAALDIEKDADMRLIESRPVRDGERVVALTRAETDPCEAGTVGCCVDHAHDDNESCETW